jgi:hypothetical protein
VATERDATKPKEQNELVSGFNHSVGTEVKRKQKAHMFDGLNSKEKAERGSANEAEYSE